MGARRRAATWEQLSLFPDEVHLAWGRGRDTGGARGLWGSEREEPRAEPAWRPRVRTEGRTVGRRGRESAGLELQGPGSAGQILWMDERGALGPGRERGSRREPQGAAGTPSGKG